MKGGVGAEADLAVPDPPRGRGSLALQAEREHWLPFASSGSHSFKVAILTPEVAGEALGRKENQFTPLNLSVFLCWTALYPQPVSF